MPPILKLLFEVVHKAVLPRGEHRHEATFCDMGITYAKDMQDPMDWPALIICHMRYIIDPTPYQHQLVFGNHSTYIINAF